ncbi:MAG: hypothetical protein CM15mP127_07820 [Gammaproteobacteria bacterium]|nr:MAG: hypothetical protein CM15mP127_07820 [Gammaproteobacteria bacterium]
MESLNDIDSAEPIINSTGNGKKTAYLFLFSDLNEGSAGSMPTTDSTLE